MGRQVCRRFCKDITLNCSVVIKVRVHVDEFNLRRCELPVGPELSSLDVAALHNLCTLCNVALSGPKKVILSRLNEARENARRIVPADPGELQSSYCKLSPRLPVILALQQRFAAHQTRLQLDPVHNDGEPAGRATGSRRHSDALARALRAVPSVGWLCIGDVDFADPDRAYLDLASAVPATLMRLDVSRSAMTPVGLAAVLRAMPRLTQLSLCAVPPAGLHRLFPALHAAAGLRRLSLTRNQLGGQWRALGVAGPEGRLEALDLSDNDLDEDDAAAVAATLRGCPRLATLVLALNPLLDTGAAAVAAGLPAGLTRLDVRHCGLGDAGAVSIAAALEGAPGPGRLQVWCALACLPPPPRLAPLLLVCSFAVLLPPSHLSRPTSPPPSCIASLRTVSLLTCLSPRTLVGIFISVCAGRQGRQPCLPARPRRRPGPSTATVGRHRIVGMQCLAPPVSRSRAPCMCARLDFYERYVDYANTRC
jgi:hypothetical protein